MNKRAVTGENTGFSDVKLLDSKQLCSYLNLGRSTAEAFGKACGAKLKIGRCARYDRTVIDAKLAELSKSGTNTDILEAVNAESEAGSYSES